LTARCIELHGLQNGLRQPEVPDIGASRLDLDPDSSTGNGGDLRHHHITRGTQP
jgi:DNA primase